MIEATPWEEQQLSVEFLRAQVASWLWVCGNKAFYRVAAAAAELWEAAQLTCVYLGYSVLSTLALVYLGMCLGLGMRLAYSSWALGPVHTGRISRFAHACWEVFHVLCERGHDKETLGCGKGAELQAILCGWRKNPSIKPRDWFANREILLKVLFIRLFTWPQVERGQNYLQLYVFCGCAVSCSVCFF